MSGLHEATARDFTTTYLPFFNGAQVILQINNREFSVSKEILCRASLYFSKALNSGFLEGQRQVVKLDPMKGVVSQRSVEALIQWIYTAKVNFNPEDVNTPSHHISTILEFVRLADMRDMTGMESQMAKTIEDILRANPATVVRSSVNRDIKHVLPEHILSVELLPSAHPVRRVLARASVGAYLGSRKEYKFASQLGACPKFTIDLLEEVGKALDNTKTKEGFLCFQDPITKEWAMLNETTGYRWKE